MRLLFSWDVTATGWKGLICSGQGGAEQFKADPECTVKLCLGFKGPFLENEHFQENRLHRRKVV